MLPFEKKNGGGEGEALRRVAPAVDIFERGSALVLLADLPGVASGDVKIDVDKDVLTISARFPADAHAPGTEVHGEIEPREYHRAFDLGPDLDPARITATMKNGVLELALPKAERAIARKIEVKLA
jgi:HSP20 family molecular chaperone IbpA